MFEPRNVLRSPAHSKFTQSLAAATLACLLTAVGCGGGQSEGGAQVGSSAAPSPAQTGMPPGGQQMSVQQASGTPGNDGGDLGVAGAVVGAAPTQAEINSGGAYVPPPVPSGAVQAQVGVGAKGRSLDQFQGAVVTPAKTLFAAKERVVFDIQVPQALQLFKATNGQGPATHDEFMQRVIAENNIQLPQLPGGRRYQYDPATEQLMVAPE